MMLALAIAAMASLQDPATVDRLGRTFGLDGRPASQPAAAMRRGESAASDRTLTVPAPIVALGPAWDAVEDNAPFLDSEDRAWYGLIAAISELSPEETQRRCLGETTYAQLRAQPEAYRGRIVTLRGTVRQVVKKQLPPNPLDLMTIYQLWIAPAGGGEWPFVVYVRNLPTGFPASGNDLREPATIQAAFFKNWSYSYGDGVGVAPAAVAATFDWQQQRSRQSNARAADSPPSAWALVGAAAIIAMAWVAWAARRTRPSARASLADKMPGAGEVEAIDVRDRLARLADEGPSP